MRRALGLLVLVLSVVALAPTAWASSPTHAQATGPGVGQSATQLRTAGATEKWAAVDMLSFAGGIIGNPTDTYTYTVHADGSITGHGTETCSPCTIGGRTGSYTQEFNFTATPNFATFQGHFAFVDAGGGLAGLHGQGTFQGVTTSATGFNETMDLNYTFEP